MKLKFTTLDVLDWARTKPRDECYSYIDNRNCPIAQFLKETNRAIEPVVFPRGWREEGERDWHDYAKRIDKAAVGPKRGMEDFGAFADRLAKLVA